mmetsp:Transcript_11648/g.23797  ORF Transcript_11648/g.23797 Transcript_11648/m.23797 type:complete len:1089 (+) Transcript_11648:227-3493(+)
MTFAENATVNATTENNDTSNTDNNVNNNSVMMETPPSSPPRSKSHNDNHASNNTTSNTTSSTTAHTPPIPSSSNINTNIYREKHGHTRTSTPSTPLSASSPMTPSEEGGGGGSDPSSGPDRDRLVTPSRSDGGTVSAGNHPPRGIYPHYPVATATSSEGVRRGCGAPGTMTTMADLTPVISNSNVLYVDHPPAEDDGGGTRLCRPDVGGGGDGRLAGFVVVSPAMMRNVSTGDDDDDDGLNYSPEKNAGDGNVTGNHESRPALLRRRSAGLQQRRLPPPRSTLPPAKRSGADAGMLQRMPSAGHASGAGPNATTPIMVPQWMTETEDGAAAGPGTLPGEGFSVPVGGLYSDEYESSVENNNSAVLIRQDGTGGIGNGILPPSVVRRRGSRNPIVMEGTLQQDLPPSSLAPIELKPDRKFFSFSGTSQYKRAIAVPVRGTEEDDDDDDDDDVGLYVAAAHRPSHFRSNLATIQSPSRGPRQRPPTSPKKSGSHPPPPPPHGNPYYAYPPPYAHPPAIYGGTPHRPSSSHVTPPNEPNNRTGDVDEQDNVTRIHPLLKDYNPHFDGIALRPQFRIIGRNKGKKSKDSFTEGGGDETKESAANDDAGNGATATRKRRRRRKPTEKAAAAAAMAAAAAAAAAAAKERKERLARLRAAKESADVVDEDRSADPDPDKDDGQSTRTERDRTQRSERDHDQDKPEEDDDDHREEEEEEEELKNLDPGSDEDIPASKRAAMASAAALRAAASGSPLRPPKAASEVEFDIADPPLEPIHPPSEEAVLESAMEMTENDVLCGRGGGTNSQMGNRRFRALVRDFQPTYLMARRREKPLMARSIVLIVRKRGGRFLRRDEEKGQLFEVGDEKAEAKTSQALREGLDVRATKTAANTLLGTDGSKRRKRLPVPNEDGTEPKIDMPLANMEPIQVDTAGARRVSKQEEEATPGIGQPVLHPAPQADCRAPPMPPHRYLSEPYYGRPDYGPPPPHPGGYGHHPSYSYYLPPPPPPRLGSDPYYPSYDYGPPTPIRSHHVPYPPPPSYSYPPHPSSSTPGMHPSYSYTSPAMSYDSQFSPPRNEGRKRQNPNPLTPVHSRVNHL